MDSPDKERGKEKFLAAQPHPLCERSVMVTRSRAQSAEMTALLEQAGARVIHCPTIEVVDPVSWQALDSAIERLGEYDWAIFTSANGVEFFFRRLKEKAPGRAAEFDRLTVCAIGPATARSIEAAGARADVIATESKAEGALKAIVEHVGGLDAVRGLRFLIPRARVARDVLPVELGKLGAQVDAVEAYQTIRPDVDGLALLRLFEQGSVDAITFTSPSTVSNFAALVGRDDLATLLAGVVVACIGPVTAAAARERGIKDVVQPRSYNAAALVEALIDSFAPH